MRKLSHKETKETAEEHKDSGEKKLERRQRGSGAGPFRPPGNTVTPCSSPGTDTPHLSRVGPQELPRKANPVEGRLGGSPSSGSPLAHRDRI